MDIAQITKLASDVRYALEAVSPDNLPPPMQNFPRGACGDTTLLVGAYFADNGFSDFQYVEGQKTGKVEGTWSSHAWLKMDDLIVDITADQFGTFLPKTIVTTHSEWHNSWETRVCGTADFREWNGMRTYHLYAAYGLVQRIIEKLGSNL